MAQSSNTRRGNGHEDVAAENPDLELLDSLPWKPSFHADDDPFSLLVSSNDTEGGFFTLEEIDESHYQLEPQNSDIPFDAEAKNSNAMLLEEEMKQIGATKKQKTKKNKKTKEQNNTIITIHNMESVTNDAALDYSDPVADSCIHNFEPVTIDENEFLAWEELRLHPLLMRSIHKLGFKEPSPIQKACIPPAAHQGKDVVGAAETGSGKTLAFGLPILQRLIEEQEKANRQLGVSEKAVKKYVSEGFLRALIITPTRELALQVTDHLKAVAIAINVRVVPIVGGMSTEKQERLLRKRPDIIVGTPGRLWELMSSGESHLTELHSLSFFVLDEADRMIEGGHYRELQFIIDMLPIRSSSEGQSSLARNDAAGSALQRKRRQTFVFSATIALSADFRKKLKYGSLKPKQSLNDQLNSIEILSERAGMRANAAIVDLTNASIVANKLEESFIECREEDKDAYLYYILSVHGQVRTIVFCTSISSLRHTSSLLKTLGINVSTLHAQMQQRARLKAIDCFRGNEHGILVATDVAARGLDIPGVRTIVHYQLPHSAEVYVHRSGRTARAASDGCSIALISPNDRSKFSSLCKSFSKESFRQFPLDSSFMPDILKRLSLARQIDKFLRFGSQEKAVKTWFERNAESLEYDVDKDNSEEELVSIHKKRKANAAHLKNIQQELHDLLSRPLQPKTFSHRFLAGAGISPVVQQQLEILRGQRMGEKSCGESRKRMKLAVIGQDCVEPLQALRSAGTGAQVDLKKIALKKRNLEDSRRERRKIRMEEKKRAREQRRKQRKKLKAGKQ